MPETMTESKVTSPASSVCCEFCGDRCVPLYDVFLGTDVTTLHRCIRCHACRVSPPFPEHVVRAHYEQTYFSMEPGEIAKGRALADDYLAKVEAASGARPIAGRALEVGAGYGWFARVLAEKTGVSVDVVEPSVACRSYIHEHGPHADVFASLADVPSGRRYDDVFCFHVMEHLQSCTAFARSVAALLADHGRLWILTPNAASRSFRTTGSFWGWSGRNQHYQFLPRQYPADYWRRCGLVLLEARDVIPADHHYPSHWNAWARMQAARMTECVHRSPGLRSVLPRMWRRCMATLAVFAREWPGYEGFTLERRWEQISRRGPHDELLLVLMKGGPVTRQEGTSTPS